ncbi:hypothetical protein SKAU_G00388560 [Synaphobranchus kaupii]|uniref:Uncharacterized protein n=1 Tax=Synaphobranchus kaupii TaxID=118154 RepID=A0A9Q1EB30_SYNKA|nr:hypothetical protein SKAU_G00388560 [Synaphobranchus kaupii]
MLVTSELLARTNSGLQIKPKPALHQRRPMQEKGRVDRVKGRFRRTLHPKANSVQRPAIEKEQTRGDGNLPLIKWRDSTGASAVSFQRTLLRSAKTCAMGRQRLSHGRQQMRREQLHAKGKRGQPRHRHPWTRVQTVHPGAGACEDSARL